MFTKKQGVDFKAKLALAPNETARSWKNPKCSLTVEVSEGSFSATGSYEEPHNALGLALAVLGSNLPTTIIRETFNGVLHGCAIVGDVTHPREDELASTRLSASDRRVAVLMMPTEDGSTINVLENPQSNAPAYYERSRAWRPIRMLLPLVTISTLTAPLPAATGRRARTTALCNSLGVDPGSNGR